MQAKNSITILSSFARDTFLNDVGNITRTEKGGPALYLTNAFTSEDVSFTVQSTSGTIVEILPQKKGGEVGRILEKPTTVSVNFQDITTPFIVISTLLDEFDLNGISKYRGKIFMDTQGYVRDGSAFGKKKYWQPVDEVKNSIFCLKGTTEELSYLPDDFIQTQKQKLLIQTMGKDGCIVFAQGNRFTIKPRELTTPTNTVGAGDTFFAYFISQFMKTSNPETSAFYAVEKTTEFLKRI